MFLFLGHYYFFQGPDVFEYDVISHRITKKPKQSIMSGC